MKTDYASSSCEQRARELLAPVTGVCPDSVWENISVELEASRKESENTWINKLNISPRTSLVAAAAVVVVTLSSWLILSHKTTPKTEVIAQGPPPVQISTVPVATTAKVIAPEVKTDNDTKPVVVEETPINQPLKQGLAMNGKPSKKQGLNSNNTSQNQSATEDKDDGKPIMIHNVGGPQVITSDEPASKGVAIDLGGDDNSTQGSSSAQTRAVQDSTGQ